MSPLTYSGVQGVNSYCPGAGVVGVTNPQGNYVELTFYQYGGTLKHDGQIFELFLNDSITGLADLSVRGIVHHRGSRINARNGGDTVSMAIAALDGRVGLLTTGVEADMPADLRIGHARPDGAFAFVVGIGDKLDGGVEVARLGEEGLRLRHRATAPSPPAGYTVLWALADGTLHKTANVGGEVRTVQMAPAS